MDVAAVQVAMLRQLEELTLHVIRQQHELKVQGKRVEAIAKEINK